MGVHRGTYIRNLIKESEYSITEVADRLSVGRNTLYRWMDHKQLPFLKMLKIANVLGVDISLDFPEVEKLEAEKKKRLLEREVNDDSLTIKTKYMLLLEKHTQLLEELSSLKEEVIRYRGGKNK
ncbi:MAG: helix-turn-helix domain-containing protein [Crocinitomicaceae bacterium]